MGKPMACRPAPDAVLGFGQTAERLGISSRTLERRLRADNSYPVPVRFGNARYFYADDVAALEAPVVDLASQSLADILND